MTLYFSPYALALFFTGATTALVASMAWRQRGMPGSTALTWLMLAVTEWCWAAGMEAMTVEIPWKILWSQVSYAGVVSCPTLFMLFALEYTHQDQWLTRRNRMILWIMPALTLFMAATNGWHSWLWNSFTPSPYSENVLVYGHGPWFWIASAYFYVSVLIGTVALLRAMVRSTEVYRRQATLLVLASIAPWIGSILYIFELMPIPGIDLAPIGFALTGLLLAWGIFRLKLLDLVPVARDAVIESMDDGVLVLDAQNRLVDMNQTLQRWFDLPRAALGKPVEQALARWPDLQQLLRAAQAQAEIRIHTGETLHLDLRLSPLKGETGQIGGRLVVLRDVTERRQAVRRLAEALELNQAIVQTSSVGILAYKVSGECVLANEAAARIINASMPQLLEQNFYRIASWQDSGLLDLARTTLATHTPQRAEIRAVTSFGQEVWLDCSLVSFTSNGEPHLLLIADDISERKEFEEQLRQAQALAEERRHAAEAANRAKSVFLANMSHELRTPLHAILGFSELMARAPDLAPEHRENLTIINRSGGHLLNLINDVLDMAKIEAGRISLQEHVFDLHGMLGRTAELFRMRAMDKGLMLSVDIAPDVPGYVLADESKLRQVLINLLGNAVKFTPEGGVGLRVYIKNEGGRAWPEQREGRKDETSTKNALPSSCLLLSFEVQDTGPGIPPEELEAIFEPFVQSGSGPKSHEGTGLGLTISRQFVRLMGGDLTASNSGGLGALFAFDVPVRAAESDQFETLQPARPRALYLEAGQPAYRLLVVEDHPDNRLLLVRLLTQFGFAVRSALSSEQAVQIWQEWRPHLILVDVRALLREGPPDLYSLKNSPEGKNTLVIALTASALEDTREQMTAKGCDDFVLKPFREQDLVDKLVYHLGARFIYADISAAGASTTETSAAPAPPLVQPEPPPADWSGLPSEWRTELRQAAIEASADKIQALAARLREQRPDLASLLEHWVNRYDYDAILAALKAEGK